LGLAIVGSCPLLPVPGATAADQAAEGTAASAPSGLVWGRLSVEEESAHGAFTPLAGVEVRAYPLAPGLLQDLERIRDTARDSARQHDTAIARLRETLGPAASGAKPANAPHRSTVEATPPPREESGPVPSQPAPGSGAEPERRRSTDSAGVFAFHDLPPGEWLLVAIRVTPYASRQAAAENPRGRQTKASRFSGSTATPTDVRHAEVWVAPVRVGPGERVRLFWTDRSRFMAGPVSGG
jgi:hypothetical protein